MEDDPTDVKDSLSRGWSMVNEQYYVGIQEEYKQHSQTYCREDESLQNLPSKGESFRSDPPM